MDAPEHFIGCHPEHEHGDRQPASHAGGEPENCWHCGTLTPRGCHCPDCLDGMDYVPPDASYHCPTCGRWWAWMTPVITEITFGDKPEEG